MFRSRSARRVLAGALVALALGLVAPAAPARPLASCAPTSFLAWLWESLAGWAGRDKEGPGMDPNGLHVVTPGGELPAAGGRLDPGGLAKEGSSMDPGGLHAVIPGGELLTEGGMMDPDG